MSICIGVANKARDVKSVYIGVNGTARRVKSIYYGVNNKAQLVYSSISSIIKDIPAAVGQTCTWAGYNWTVVHVTTDLIYMILTNIHSKCKYGPYGRYHDSTVYAQCREFLNTIDAVYRNALSDVTIDGITCKVFLPTVVMAGTGVSNHDYTKYPTFDYFNSKYTNEYSNRKANYNGTATPWWLSDGFNEADSSWYVTNRGRILASGDITSTYGFRPSVAMRRK